MCRKNYSHLYNHHLEKVSKANTLIAKYFLPNKLLISTIDHLSSESITPGTDSNSWSAGSSSRWSYRERGTVQVRKAGVCPTHQLRTGCCSSSTEEEQLGSGLQKRSERVVPEDTDCSCSLMKSKVPNVPGQPISQLDGHPRKFGNRKTQH